MLLTVGIVLAFIAVFLILVSILPTPSADVKGGAFLLISPFPLVLTFDKPTFWLLLLLPILFILIPLILFLAWLRVLS